MKIMGTKILAVTSTKSFNKLVPRITLAGVWLNEIGFKSGELVAVEYLKENIIFKLQGEGTIENYMEVAKKLLKDKSHSLIHVYSGSNIKKNFPHIQVIGVRLKDAGFSIGSVVVAKYEYGVIKLKVLDIDKV